jgi:hypothetical protein
MKIRPLIPLKLIIAAVVLLALSFVMPSILEALSPGYRDTSNVLLIALPFLLTFVPIILGFMAVIVFVSKILERKIPETAYKIVEYVFIAGILVGIVSMFQPWTYLLFKPGFFVLFGSLIGFMVWSHVLVKRARR